MSACLPCSADDALVVDVKPIFLRKMNGSGQALLVRDSFSCLWILKLKSGLQGPNALANDMLGSLLCRAIGLPVPEVRPFEIPYEFFDDRDTWLEMSSERVRPEPGVHFASRFFPDVNGTEVIEFLPPALRSMLSNRTDCLGMFLFDVWAQHADRRQALFFAHDGRMRATFIDHSHLFRGPNWKGKTYQTDGRMLERVAAEVYSQRGEREYWIDKIQEVIPSAFEAALAAIPCHWYSGDIRELQTVYLDRLQRLRSFSEEAIVFGGYRTGALIASEERAANAPIRILSCSGADLWL